jgi:glycosyltransferase involved in cell wall biosynthesis
LGIESPLALRGGVNMIIEQLVEGLLPYYRIVLVSMDASHELPAPWRAKLHGHICWNPASSRTQAWAVARQAQALGVQVANFHGGVFGFGQRFFGHSPLRPMAQLGIKVFWTNHTWVHLLDGYCGPQKPLWFKLGMLPFAWLSRVRELAAVQQVLTSSALTLAQERRWYWPVREKFRLLYFSRLRESAPQLQMPRQRTVLAVGHLARRKGQLVLAQAFARIAARHPDWRLILIGPAVEEDYSRQVADALQPLGAQAEWVGPQQETLADIASAGIFVQPSFWEGLPFALQEAMFLSCPCVATRCYGNIELITHEENGLMVEPGDVAGLAGALERLIEDSLLRARLAAAARPFILATGMTFERMIAHHCALFTEALSGRRLK